MTQRFTPPTRAQATDDHFWGRFGSREGMSIVRINGVLTTTTAPLFEETEGLVEGVDYFIGGHVYVVTGDVEQELLDAGYVTEIGEEGYGEGEYGDGGYGY